VVRRLHADHGQAGYAYSLTPTILYNLTELITVSSRAAANPGSKISPIWIKISVVANRNLAPDCCYFTAGMVHGARAL